MGEFSVKDVLDPKKNKRVAKLLEDDKVKWDSVKKDENKIQYPGSKAIKNKNTVNKLYSNSKPNLSFLDNGKLDIDTIAKTVRQNLPKSIKGDQFVDSFEMRDKSHSGGLFFERSKQNHVSSEKNSKFKSFFSNFFSKEQNIQYLELANLCKNQVEQSINNSSSISSDDLEPIDDANKDIETNKNEVLSQLQSKFDIKNVYSSTAEEPENIIENGVYENKIESSEEVAEEPEEKKDQLDSLKADVLSKLNDVFKLN